MSEKMTKLNLQEAFDLILEEFRNRIVPEVFAVGNEKPHWSSVPTDRRADMFVKYVKHLEDKELINNIQASALELKYLDDVFGIFSKKGIKNENK